MARDLFQAIRSTFDAINPAGFALPGCRLELQSESADKENIEISTQAKYIGKRIKEYFVPHEWQK